jgi:hypothetical protein
MCYLISDYSRTLKSQYMLGYLGMHSYEFRVTLASGQILKFSDIRLFIFGKFSVTKYNQTRTNQKSLVKALRQGAC